MIPQQSDLFAPPAPPSGVLSWCPRPLEHEEWPPNYAGLYAWRMEMIRRFRADRSVLEAAHAFYTTHPVEWICHWCDTYNPRKKTMKWMPFVLFRRQAEFVDFVESLRQDNENGLVEKCRDVGATWLACAYSVWTLRYISGDATGWGSRKEDMVDKSGVVDSIFEKIRLLIHRLPDEFKPETKNAFMRVVNKSNGSVIVGEAGDNIGRGGRTSRFWKDESAHYERPEKIEAALGDNTDVQIDISSVNGMGNMFYKRRKAGQVWKPGVELEKGRTRVFIFDWRDHPAKDQEWYDLRKRKHEREGTQHIFAQEVERNYSAAVENTVIDANWIEAAVDAHLKIPVFRTYQSDEWMAGLDVADQGGDRNALALRNGVILRHIEEWGDRDPGVTTRRMLAQLREMGRRDLEIQYDCIGIGSAIKAEFNSLVERGEIAYSEYRLVKWHAGASVVDPFAHLTPDDDESPINREFFHNMKAQAWWSLRTRFYKTWRALNGEDTYDADELISLDGSMRALEDLKSQLTQPIRKQSAGSLRMVVDKAPGTTDSPNAADAVVQCFFPAPETGSTVDIGSYGV